MQRAQLEKKRRGIKGKDDAYQTKDSEALTGQAVNKTYLQHDKLLSKRGK